MAAQPAVFLMLYAGLRIAEVAELRWGDIDLDRGEIIVRTREQNPAIFAGFP